MSFSIPIFVEDSSFFERDRLHQRQPRNKSHRFAGRVEEREPPSNDAFQTWTRPEFVSDEDPRDESYYRPNYQNRGRREEFLEQPMRNERAVRPQRKAHTQKLGREQENMYGMEDPRGVNVDRSDHYGWDIPVQFVEAPAGTRERHSQHRRHKQQQHPWQYTTRENNVQSKNEEVQASDQRLPKPSQGLRQERDVNKDKVTKGVVVDHVVDQEKLKAGDQDNTTEEVPVDEAQQEQNVGRKDQTKNLENNDEKASQDDNGDTEIPVQHVSHDTKPRSSSKRFSQCDPPSPMEIKLMRIKSIIEKCQDLENNIKGFGDPVQNQAYLYISESLTRLLLDLDTVDSEGIDVVRKARKDGVQIIQCLVDGLENRLTENKKNVEPE